MKDKGKTDKNKVEKSHEKKSDEEKKDNNDNNNINNINNNNNINAREDKKQDENKQEPKKDEHKQDNPKTKEEKSEKKEPVRKIYFGMKVNRFSDIDTVQEQFRCRLSVYCCWVLTYKEYQSYCKAKKDGKLATWEPEFAPRFEFTNEIETQKHEKVKRPPYYGEYSVEEVVDFSDIIGFNCAKAHFCRIKLQCDMLFSEQMELNAFPLDCQDFCVVFRETTGTKIARLVPEPRFRTIANEEPSIFVKIDPTFSVLDEWDFYSTRVEFLDSESEDSRSGSVYSQVSMRFKLRRKWSTYFWNIIFYFMILTLLSLSGFVLDTVNGGNRLTLIITILLTQIAFQYIVTDRLPKIPYLTILNEYIIASFIFVSVVTIQSGCYIRFKFSGHVDTIFGFALCAVWLLYHLFFLLYAIYRRTVESCKLDFDSYSIKKKVNNKVQFLMPWKGYLKLVDKKEELSSSKEWTKKQQFQSLKTYCKDNDFKKFLKSNDPVDIDKKQQPEQNQQNVNNNSNNNLIEIEKKDQNEEEKDEPEKKDQNEEEEEEDDEEENDEQDYMPDDENEDDNDDDDENQDYGNDDNEKRKCIPKMRFSESGDILYFVSRAIPRKSNNMCTKIIRFITKTLCRARVTIKCSCCSCCCNKTVFNV